MKLLVSASQKDAAQVSLNDYFYSTTYKINDDGVITWKDGEVRNDLKYKFHKGRHKIFRL